LFNAQQEISQCIETKPYLSNVLLCLSLRARFGISQCILCVP
jgi:hypothetical protein